MRNVEYGDNYQAHLLEQYKLYVEMADRISQRRDQSNRFYAGAVSAIVALLVVAARFGLPGTSWDVALLVAGLFGAALSTIWYINLRSYQVLNSVKFEVINGIEPLLPHDGYTQEWAQLLSKSRPGKYLQLTKVERFVPLLIAALFICLVGFSVYSFAWAPCDGTLPASHMRHD